MDIAIKNTSLIDSPFEVLSCGDFMFDNNEINDFALDLIRGNPTCYLISGYRGVGKSSLIKKVETVVLNENESVNKFKGTANHILFVPTNFSRYKSQSYLLRKLIRALYLAIDDEKNKNVKILLANKSKESDVLKVIEALYDHTFHEIENTSSYVKEKTKGAEISWNIKDIIFQSLKLLAPILVTALWSFNNKYAWWSMGDLADTCVIGGAIVLTLFNSLTITGFWKKQSTESQQFHRKTLYDDEIADHHYINVLSSLVKQGIKVVFVLDELDKVDETESNQLMHEMKPYLVCGLASFIVVAGQKTYYKYFMAQAKDDEVIATLFSRTIHVPLFTTGQLSELFRKLIAISMETQELEKIQPYVDYLIFKSKRIPRRFINLIRQDLIWNQDSEGSVLRIDENHDYSQYTKTLNLIAQIEEDQISGRIDGAIADFLVMRLFVDAELQMSNSELFDQLTA